MPGSYGIMKGAQTLQQACQACPKGRYSSVPGSSSCLPCNVGTFADTAGAATCTACAAGRFSNSVGSFNSSSCLLCPAGTFGLNEGQSLSGCTGCSRGSYGVKPGMTDESTACRSCPEGLTTATQGANSVVLCQRLPVTCPSGMEPSIPPAVYSLSDCTPIVCAAPLAPLYLVNGSLRLAAQAAAAGSPPMALGQAQGCGGCAPGLAGVFPSACTPCPMYSICPGFISRPLANLTSCAAVLWGSLPEREASVILAFSSVPSDTGLWRGLLGTAAGLLFLLLLFTVYSRVYFSTAAHFASRQPLPLSSLEFPRRAQGGEGDFHERVRQRVLNMDIFRQAHPVQGDNAPRNLRTLFGSAWTLLALSTLLLAVLYYVMLYISFRNVTVNSALEVLVQSKPDAALPWLATPELGASGGLRTLRGLAVRVLAQGEPGACSQPLSFSFSSGSLSKGAWELVASSNSTGSSALCDQSALQSFTLVCALCDIRGQEVLNILLHYSCQSIALDALASGPSLLDLPSLAQPQAYLYSRPAPQGATSGNSSSFLSAFSHTVTVYHSQVLDQRSDLGAGYGLSTVRDISGRGYVLGGAVTGSNWVNATRFLDEDGTLPFTPRLQSIQGIVTFDVQDLLSTQTVRNTITLPTLMGSLLSLLSLLGLFRFFFSAFESCCCALKPQPEEAPPQLHPQQRDFPAAPPASPGEGKGAVHSSQSGPPPTMASNPLFSHAGPRREPLEVASPASATASLGGSSRSARPALGPLAGGISTEKLGGSSRSARPALGPQVGGSSTEKQQLFQRAAEEARAAAALSAAAAPPLPPALRYAAEAAEEGRSAPPPVSAASGAARGARSSFVWLPLEDHGGAVEEGGELGEGRRSKKSPAKQKPMPPWISLS